MQLHVDTAASRQHLSGVQGQGIGGLFLAYLKWTERMTQVLLIGERHDEGSDVS